MDDISIKRLVAERIHFTSQDVLDIGELEHMGLLANMELGTFLDQKRRQLIMYLDADLPGILAEEINIDEQWPADWWQAFKERWFPAWVLRRWPVQYEGIALHKKVFGAVCPHVNVKKEGRHIEWMVRQQEKVE